MVAAVALVASAPARAEEALDRSRVSWTRLEYTARKIGETATILVSVRDVPAVEAAGAWLSPMGGTPVMPPGGVVLIESETRLASRVFDDRLWLDERNASAVQIADTETGHNLHGRTYRLCQGGFALEERLPDTNEDSLPPAQWSRVKRSWCDFPPGLASGSPVTGPMGLLWAAAAAGALRVGDTLTFPVLVQGHVEEVTLRMEGPAAADVDMVESRAGIETRVRGLTGVMRASLTARPLGDPGSARFRMLGLEGDIQLLWDPARGLPVEISGDVRLLGHLVIRLTRFQVRGS